MKHTSALTQLHKHVDGLITDLARYSLKPEARQEWIDYQNGVINNLVDAYNAMESMKLGNFWMLLEEQMKKAETEDPHLCQHNIVIRVKPEGHYSSFIEINSFQR